MDTEQNEQFDEKAKHPSVVAQAFDTARRVETQTGRPRHFLSAGALGTCLVFIVGMLSLPRLDQPLTIALYAFVIAMPLLVVDYFSASIEVGNEPRNLLVQALFLAGWIVGDALGPLAVYMGIVSVVWHLNTTAGVILIVWSIGVMVVVICVMLVSIFIYAWCHEREGHNNTPSIPKSSPNVADE